MKTMFFRALPFLLPLVYVCRLPAQSDTVYNIFSRLQQFDPLEVVIETDIKKLRSNTGTETQWQGGVFKIVKDNAAVFEQKIQITARGNMRKKTCDFPPVKIRFYEHKMKNDSLEDVNELKLVVACRNTNDDDQLVMKECLAYKLYNLMTEESFRVKEASVRFVTPGKKKADWSARPFLLKASRNWLPVWVGAL